MEAPPSGFSVITLQGESDAYVARLLPLVRSWDEATARVAAHPL